MKKVIFAVIVALFLWKSFSLEIAKLTVQELREERDFFQQEQERMKEINKRLVRNSYQVPLKQNTQNVVFTNYYTGDATGSGKRTGSGFYTSDFEINEKGWYTYEGFVVVATATNECLNSMFGGCKVYKKVPDGFHIFNYYDTLTITIDDVDYPAIVLDSCGACFWERELQTVDIFILNEKVSFGKTKGSIVWN